MSAIKPMSLSNMIEVARDVAYRLRAGDLGWRSWMPLLLVTSGASAEQIEEVRRYMGSEWQVLGKLIGDPLMPGDSSELGSCEMVATFNAVEGMEPGSEEVVLRASWWSLQLWHDQDCCEHVWLEDVVGDPADIIGVPVQITVETSEGEPDDFDTSRTWTFYHFRSPKGDVTLRWCGESNGYYSEEVDWAILINKETT